MKGKLILIVGPSGSGKGTLVAHLKKVRPELTFPRSCTTRAPRPGESHGDNYFFLTRDEFDAKIAENAFLEWAEFSGNNYGTLTSEITDSLAEGKILVREIDIQGARKIQEKISREDIIFIFVDVGKWEVLRDRIIARAPIRPEEIEMRKERFEIERSFLNEADYSVPNDGPIDATIQAFDSLIDRIVSDVRMKVSSNNP